MKNRAAWVAVGACLLASGSVAHAQTTAKDQPTAVGTSQQTANEAQRKAAKEGGTATVVRTGPTAGDKAKQVASDSGDKVRGAAGKARAKTGKATDDAKNP